MTISDDTRVTQWTPLLGLRSNEEIADDPRQQNKVILKNGALNYVKIQTCWTEYFSCCLCLCCDPKIPEILGVRSFEASVIKEYGIFARMAFDTLRIDFKKMVREGSYLTQFRAEELVEQISLLKDFLLDKEVQDISRSVAYFLSSLNGVKDDQTVPEKPPLVVLPESVITTFKIYFSCVVLKKALNDEEVLALAKGVYPRIKCKMKKLDKPKAFHIISEEFRKKGHEIQFPRGLLKYDTERTYYILRGVIDFFESGLIGQLYYRYFLEKYGELIATKLLEVAEITQITQTGLHLRAQEWDEIIHLSFQDVRYLEHMAVQMRAFSNTSTARSLTPVGAPRTYRTRSLDDTKLLPHSPPTLSPPLAMRPTKPPLPGEVPD